MVKKNLFKTVLLFLLLPIISISVYSQSAEEYNNIYPEKKAVLDYLREHLKYGYRMHYVILEGGEAPNVVPDKASVWYFVRNSDEKVQEMYEKVVNCAKAAALATGTELTNCSLQRCLYGGSCILQWTHPNSIMLCRNGRKGIPLPWEKIGSDIK